MCFKMFNYIIYNRLPALMGNGHMPFSGSLPRLVQLCIVAVLYLYFFCQNNISFYINIASNKCFMKKVLPGFIGFICFCRKQQAHKIEIFFYSITYSTQDIRNTLGCDQSNVYSSRDVFWAISRVFSFFLFIS